MPRRPRVCPAGHAVHVLNRAAGRQILFESPADYDAFVRVVERTVAIVPLPILAYVVMPNHWHFVVHPATDGQVSDFFRRLTVTHTTRWQAHRHAAGEGHLYQGRFKAFLVADDEHLLTVMRYVERNPVRAGLVGSAGDWVWGSARYRGRDAARRPGWLVDPAEPRLPTDWPELVDRPLTEAEAAAVQRSIARERPLGGAAWVERTVAAHGLESTTRGRGRPRKLTPPDDAEGGA